MPIIVNADDFGLSQTINDAVVQSFERNWISSATALTNMPFFEQAAELVHEHRLAGKIGVHLNLTQGTSLTKGICRYSRLCAPDGRLCARPQDLFRVSPGERKAIVDEFLAQIHACRTRGFEPSHLDSHHHVHQSWAVGTVVIEIARELRIRFIRPAHNTGVGISRMHRLYSALFNQRLRIRGMAGVRYFCGLPFATEKQLDAKGGVEIMVHPIMDAAGGVIDSVYGGVLGIAVEDLLRGRSCVSYGDLVRR